MKKQKLVEHISIWEYEGDGEHRIVKECTAIIINGSLLYLGDRYVLEKKFISEYEAEYQFEQKEKYKDKQLET